MIWSLILSAKTPSPTPQIFGRHLPRISGHIEEENGGRAGWGGDLGASCSMQKPKPNPLNLWQVHAKDLSRERERSLVLNAHKPSPSVHGCSIEAIGSLYSTNDYQTFHTLQTLLTNQTLIEVNVLVLPFWM